MAIRIKKAPNMLCSAELTLPDMPGVAESWVTTEPMSVDQIVEELLRRGARQSDIGDALYAADPDWLSR
jgi:hypothetical protein